MKITKKNNIIKTLPHDSKSILPSINQINNDDVNKNIKYSSFQERIRPKGYNLVGDKGFIINTKYIPSNVNLIAVKRNNQIVKNIFKIEIKKKIKDFLFNEYHRRMHFCGLVPHVGERGLGQFVTETDNHARNSAWPHR